MTLSRRAVIGFGLLLLLPWAAFLIHQLDHAQGPASPRSLETSGAAAPSAAEAAAAPARQAGPWGELVVSRIVIEPPESMIGLPGQSRQPIAWTFPQATAERLEQLWRQAGLSPAEFAHINDRSRWEISAEGVRVRPSDEFVLGLSPNARAVIYTALAASAENVDQHEPYRFRAEIADEWFQQSELQPATIERVKRLLYRRGTSLLFSDLSLVLPHIDSLAERVQLVKTLSRKSTLMVKIRLRDSSDIETLERYWGRGQRSRDIEPILRSLARQGRGATLDIIHLLPRVPRSLLYTYPTALDAGNGTFLDCHWTALNFFNLRPDDRYQDLEAVREAFTRDYFAISGKPTFGDVLLFMRKDDSVIHSCVYIADGIVFTKNGAHANAPWILMELSDVVAFYPTDEPFEVQYYRARNVPVQ